MAKTNSAGASGAGAGATKQKTGASSVEEVMSQVTGAGLAAIQKAAGEKVRTSGKQRPDYPGAEARLYKSWYISKSADSVQEIIIVGAPQVMYCYRMCYAVRRNGQKIYPDIAIHQSVKYHHAVQDGVPYKAERADTVDLYAETFGAPEMWTIVPVLVRMPKFDERRNRLPGYKENYQFLELEPGDGILNTLIDVWQTKAVATREGGLIGTCFDVRRTADDDPAHGRWTRMTQDKGDGNFTYKMFEPRKILAYIKQQGEKRTDNDPNSKKRALYVSTVAEAYPVAELDKQKMVLATHFGIIEGHPDFAKRFPTPLKDWGTDMSGGSGEITLDGPSGDGTDGDEISLDDIDGGGESMLAAGGETIDPVDSTDDGDEIDLGEDPAEEEAGEEAGEEETGEEGPVIYYANDKDDTDGYILPDGTPCDEYGDALEATEEAEEAGEEEAGEEVEEAGEEEAAEESADVSSEDGAQEPGIADLEGDVSAFSHTELDEEEQEEESEPAPKKAASKAVKPTAKPAAKPAVKAKPKPKPAAKPAAKPVASTKPKGKVAVKVAAPKKKGVAAKKKK